MTHDSGQRDYDEMGIPGLLRMARKAYGNEVMAAFADGGFDDVPRNGAYVLGSVWADSSCFPRLTRELGVSKQAASQLIDTMAMRGYLERTPDAEDRRRMLLTLTPRGEAAATVSWQAACRVDEELARRLPEQGVQALRAGLIALCAIAAAGRSDGDDPPAASRGHDHPHPHDHQH
jgi:DNA-binding MarR family transcriptional regulator